MTSDPIYCFENHLLIDAPASSSSKNENEKTWWHSCAPYRGAFSHKEIITMKVDTEAGRDRLVTNAHFEVMAACGRCVGACISARL
jgi:hypothetical protein